MLVCFDLMAPELLLEHLFNLICLNLVVYVPVLHVSFQGLCTMVFHPNNCTFDSLRPRNFPRKVNNLIIGSCCLINNWSYAINVTFLLTSTAKNRYWSIICTPQRPISLLFFQPPNALCHPLSPQGIMLHRPLSQIIPYCAPNMSLHSAGAAQSFCFHSIHNKIHDYC